MRPRGPRPTLGILRPPQCPPKPSSRSRKWRRRTTRTRASEPHAPWRPRPCPAARRRRRAARPRRHDHGQRGKRADTPGEQARQGPFAAHGVLCGHGRGARSESSRSTPNSGGAACAGCHAFQRDVVPRGTGLIKGPSRPSQLSTLLVGCPLNHQLNCCQVVYSPWANNFDNTAPYKRGPSKLEPCLRLVGPR